MLCELTIENIAVIEKATVNFEKGFNVLTGETGAGKSIVIDSVSALLGHRLAKDVIRNGADKATICAVFNNLPKSVCSIISDLGFEYDDQLIVTRELSIDGRGSVRINGRPALVSMLKEFMPRLLSIHGQQDNHILVNPETQLILLDRFGELYSIRNEYLAIYRQLCERIKLLNNLTGSEEKNQERTEFLKFQIEEIEKAAFKADEPTRLQNRRSVLINIEKILQGLSGAKQAINDDEGGTLISLTAAVTALSGVDEVKIKEFKDRAEALYYELQELSVDIAAELNSIESQPGELETIEQRLDEYYKLRKKYGEDVNEIELYKVKAIEELSFIENGEEKIAELEEEIENLGDTAKKLANKLTKERKKTFEKLEKEVVSSLAELKMPGMKFELAINHKALTKDGCDEIEFLIATNPGELPKPLSKVASGGELARIMLAIKNSLAEADDMPTVIYDEIDTGVSGSASYKIGKMMHNTADNRQVLAVTHSAQLACFADNHLLIEKSTNKNLAKTQITQLNKEGRVYELARIMSGDSITQTAMANAEELLTTANKGVK